MTRKMPTTDPVVTPELVKQHGLTPEEFEQIKKILGREPNFTELGIFSGIAHYGNCVGIPTIGGEIYFDESFEGNPLVNVFCLGVLRHEQLARGAARGVGNPVFYVGAETGRDGLAGAAFASRELTEQSREDRPAVQVGDPFKEKLLLEACLELLARGAVAGIQDMGAAGLTCSTCETASRADSGIEIDLAKVPKREPGMTPYEILLSESQERMLIIARHGKEDVVREVFEKWDVPCAEIGRVTSDGIMRVRNNGQIAAEIPAKALAEEAPLYSREAKKNIAEITEDAEIIRKISALSASSVIESLRQVLRDPTIASKNWVYRQYDHTVRTGTIVKPGSDAAVFFVRYANKILAASTDCNSTYCALDPREGGKIAVAEAARNLTCSGARPLALTDCLNFGNPYKPQNFWQLREAVEGVAEACREFGTPITGGNVSLYNESPAGIVDPTPTIAMVGLIDHENHITTQWFKNEGDAIILVGKIGGELGGSHYVKVCHHLKIGPPPHVDLPHEIKIQSAVRGLIREGLVKSAHDCSEGGLAVALAECCFNPEELFGAKIALNADDTSATTVLFNESQSRILEIACGTGIVTRRLRDALPATTEIIATDLNPDMFEFAKPKFRNGENVLWQQADASALPFPNCSSDAAVCQFGVMFVPDKAAAMRESYRVLRSGGVFLFNVWDSFEANPFGQIAHTTIASFFDPDPPNSYKTSFGFH